MFSVLTRLFRSRRRRRATVTCFIRENGPIAYEADLFGEPPREGAQSLMASSLSWAWKSGTREWTHLTQVSLSAFLADLPGGALIVGAESELPIHLTDDAVKSWLRQFCRVGQVPVAVVIDASRERQLLFVQQHAPAAVNGLLGALRLDRRAAQRSSYGRLGASSLESIADRL